MPRPTSQAPNSAYYSPDPMSPTFSPPGEYTEFQTLRPSTPASFGRYSVMSGLTLDSEKHDRDGATTPQAQALLPAAPDGVPGQRSSTYYFNKEGGAAAAAAAGSFHQYQGRRGQGYNPANPAGLERGLAPNKPANFIKRRPLLFSLILLAILIIIGVAAGVGVSQATKSNDKNLSAAASNKANNSGSNTPSSSDNSGNSNSNGNGNGNGNGASGTTSAAPAAPTITPFRRWNWTDTNTKAYGVSLGSWLVLERWQLEDWMVQNGGPDAWDEWRFTQNLGSRAASVLADHQNSWVTEADMDTLENAGINLIRIPIPFWAFIPTVSPEPFVTTGYMDQLNKMLQWCYNRGMYVMLDLHAMPGSQNGDQSSGHNTTNIQWFSQANQARSDTFVEKVVQWATTSPYSSIVNSIGVVNEPRVVSDDWSLNTTRFQITQSFYERSYQTCLKYKIPMTFHNGFAPGTVLEKMNLWRPFVQDKDPNMLIYEDHPYPGWFQTPEPGADAIQSSVCEYGAAGPQFPVPVIMGEFSAIQSLNSNSYAQSYLEMQFATYAWSAGSIFWNFKASSSQNPVLALSKNLMQLYSYVDMLAAGTMPNPGKRANVRDWYARLPNPCGDFQTYGWNNAAQ
ncbi:hypothetical protein NDA10_003958 [Ustilago hordei]|uniref:glucan 1,3-beta-glucosidase n=1 Tax=Ustilago hordei TaxID=120017 RepID=I2FQ57_USTHO|nr:uncharacterized protein UHO2_06402 [Ustilago hordei]KAJ1038370.1 hypothetical protein NDA10_003958 [Ustilago hordei]CCF49050.1 related to Glucan 1,3-beta-glucosidase precursor [Ustilago hordei]SYW80940.1 related to Glucan 1,3-beta-glucosidase precursor [Ustilago hordei]